MTTHSTELEMITVSSLVVSRGIVGLGSRSGYELNLNSVALGCTIGMIAKSAIKWEESTAAIKTKQQRRNELAKIVLIPLTAAVVGALSSIGSEPLNKNNVVGAVMGVAVCTGIFAFKDKLTQMFRGNPQPLSSDASE